MSKELDEIKAMLAGLAQKIEQMETASGSEESSPPKRKRGRRRKKNSEPSGSTWRVGPPVQEEARASSAPRTRRNTPKFGDGTNQFNAILPKLKKDKDYIKADKADQEEDYEHFERTRRPPPKKVSINCKMCGKQEKVIPYDGMREVHLCKQCNKKAWNCKKIYQQKTQLSPRFLKVEKKSFGIYSRLL